MLKVKSKAVPSTILLVEDDPMLLQTFDLILTKSEFEVKTAKTAEDALTLLSEEIAVIVTDKKLPGMSGIDLKTAVRDKYPNVKIILISGDIIESEKLTYRAQGFDAVFMKPLIDVDYFLQELDSLCP